MEKIQNYLTQGVPSKIYLHCFFGPRSGYSIAKELYGHPTTHKIYIWAKKMMQEGFLTKSDAGYTVVVTPLIDEINKKLEYENETIGYDEKRLLSTLLKSEAFSGICTSLYKQMSEDEREYTNIVSLIFQILAILSSLSLNSKLIVGLPDTSIKDAIAIFSKEKEVISRRYTNPGVHEQAAVFTRLLAENYSNVGIPAASKEQITEKQLVEYAHYSLLHDLPNVLLRKLSKLSPVGGYVTHSFALASALLKMSIIEEIQVLQQSNQKQEPDTN